MEITLKAQARSEKGKGAARRARSAGKVPGVVYGSSLDPVPILVDAKEMFHALHTEAGNNVLINLDLDAGNNYLTMLREIQKDPIRGDLLHVDFVNVARDQMIHANVPIHFTGDSHGVREGGVLEHHLWELSISALPTEVPATIEIDISELGIGDSVRVADIKVPDNVEVLSDGEELVAAIVEPQLATAAELGEEPAAEEEEAATPAEGEGEGASASEAGS